MKWNTPQREQTPLNLLPYNQVSCDAQNPLDRERERTISKYFLQISYNLLRLLFNWHRSIKFGIDILANCLNKSFSLSISYIIMG